MGGNAAGVGHSLVGDDLSVRSRTTALLLPSLLGGLLARWRSLLLAGNGAGQDGGGEGE
jgi:hypothetical protein